ncbi:unnamed protein product [Rotaria socialis]|uniref:Glutaredoxin-2, mitochondrial n=2 Tax=Rotaria socialis TaxID=392032 RepID=A0A817NGV9_9BILA|nr:unnamed protein product [Rotaria socialis]
MNAINFQISNNDKRTLINATIIIFRNVFRRITLSANVASSISSNDVLVDKVQQLINNHKVIIFSKTFCPYCIKAKEILGRYKLHDYKIVELDEIPNGNEYQNILEKIIDAKTVPRIFIDGKCIGGCDDTLILHRNGDLEKILKQINTI